MINNSAKARKYRKFISENPDGVIIRTVTGQEYEFKTDNPNDVEGSITGSGIIEDPAKNFVVDVDKVVAIERRRTDAGTTEGQEGKLKPKKGSGQNNKPTE